MISAQYCGPSIEFGIMELSLPGTFVPWNEITLELSLAKWEKLQLTRICKRMTVAVDGQNCRSKND